jgi:hypothetical protein
MLSGIKKQTKIAYGAVFDTPEGEIVLADLARECYLLRPYDDDTEFCDGKRNVLLYILKVLELDTMQDFTKISNEVKNVG